MHSSPFLVQLQNNDEEESEKKKKKRRSKVKVVALGKRLDHSATFPYEVGNGGIRTRERRNALDP